MYQSFTTWTALDATLGTLPNEVAYVYGPDTGTHTDPVVGGTVANAGVYAWSSSPAGWQWVADLTVTGQTFDAVDNGGTVQNQFLWSPPPSAVNSEGGYDNVNLSIRTTKNFIPNFGDGTYGTDYVYGFGWNYNDAFLPENTDQPAVGFKIESKFRFDRLGTYVTQSEVHMGAVVPVDDPTVEFRSISIGAPHEKADWANLSTQFWQSSYWSFNDGQVPYNEWMAWDARAANGGTRYINTVEVRFREANNNFPIHQQRNAAGTSFVNLPYINAVDHIYATQPLDIQANASINMFGNVAAMGFGSVIPNGGSLIAFTDFATTGSVTLFNVRGSASTYMEQNQENQHASGASGYNAAGKGGLYFGFVDTANSASYGMRYAAATRTLSIGGQLRGAANGVGDFVSFDCQTRQATFAYPAKIVPVAVAALPDASTAGAGSRAFVSDSTDTTFAALVAGGGSTVVPVYSDGSDWRIG